VASFREYVKLTTATDVCASFYMWVSKLGMLMKRGAHKVYEDLLSLLVDAQIVIKQWPKNARDIKQRRYVLMCWAARVHCYRWEGKR